jgi:hypothetical protein
MILLKILLELVNCKNVIPSKLFINYTSFWNATSRPSRDPNEAAKVAMFIFLKIKLVFLT